MNCTHGEATDLDGGDKIGGASTSVPGGGDRTGQATPDERQLLGCVLCVSDLQAVREIARYVPVSVFSDALDRAIYGAVVATANAGEWDRPRLAALVLEAGLWPRSMHAEVTGRIVDRINECVFPSAWRTYAAAVLEAHSRRLIAEKLVGLGDVLRTRSLHEVGRALTEAGDFTQMCCDHLTGLQEVDVNG